MSEGYKEDVYSTSVRAGKRTYFFDVKTTRGNDLFMTITESKRIGHENEGNVQYEKHKIFLYKEDFDGFVDGLNKAVNEIRKMQGQEGYRGSESNRKTPQEFTSAHESSDNLSFDDLENS
jgi:Protein of unknown function (DUF3276)